MTIMSVNVLLCQKSKEIYLISELLSVYPEGSSVFKSQVNAEALCGLDISSVFCENNDLCVSCGTVRM